MSVVQLEHEYKWREPTIGPAGSDMATAAQLRTTHARELQHVEDRDAAEDEHIQDQSAASKFQRLGP